MRPSFANPLAMSEQSHEAWGVLLQVIDMEQVVQAREAKSVRLVDLDTRRQVAALAAREGDRTGMAWQRCKGGSERSAMQSLNGFLMGASRALERGPLHCFTVAVQQMQSGVTRPDAQMTMPRPRAERKTKAGPTATMRRDMLRAMANEDWMKLAELALDADSAS